MANKSDYLEAAVLNHFLRNSSTSAGTSWVALYTVTPSDSTSGTEVTGGSYARTAVTFDAPASDPKQCDNQLVTFPEATADWGTVVAWSLMDASTSGNMLYWGAISPNQEVYSGNTVSFPAASLTVSED